MQGARAPVLEVDDGGVGEVRREEGAGLGRGDVAEAGDADEGEGRHCGMVGIWPSSRIMGCFDVGI